MSIPRPQRSGDVPVLASGHAAACPLVAGGTGGAIGAAAEG
ncbi:MAG TPA: hypothetical protein VHN14_21055 [Kofleriaceae bacterium]|nr:hypothetical protein [Kofleriaceae bacterium]